MYNGIFVQDSVKNKKILLLFDKTVEYTLIFGEKGMKRQKKRLCFYRLFNCFCSLFKFVRRVCILDFYQ